jgi:DNA ligase (NAD+)
VPTGRRHDQIPPLTSLDQGPHGASVRPGKITLNAGRFRTPAAHQKGMTTAMNPTAPAVIETQAEFDALVGDLVVAAASYYDSAVLTMTDAEYDAGIDALQAALATHPEWSSDEVTGLLDYVAGGQSVGGDVTHATRMLSLDKFSPGEEGIVGASSLAAQTTDGVTVEFKNDGLAISATYKDGVLVLAATRGNGTEGENVTEQALRGINGLPKNLTRPFTGEVRGEVFMTVSDFEAAQVLRAERGGKPFVNPRNAVAGCLRKSGAENAMPMSFAAYDLIGDDLSDSHIDRMSTAHGLGLTTTRHLALGFGIESGPYRNPEVARIAIEQIEAARPTLGFDIDGAVVKADRDTDRQRLGEGSRTPKWAVAYKFPPQQSSSVIEDIEVRTGRTGRISLRARITPTFVGGTTITYASLHNPSWIEEQGIGIGSKVLVERRGDVIPRVEAPLDPSVNEGIPTWVAPETCPTCDEAWDKTSLLWRCHTPACSVAGRLDYALGGEALDVDGFGSSIAEALAENEVAKDIADLFTLTLDQWATLPVGTTATGAPRLLGETVAKKIMANLEAAKAQPFNRVITALGIRHGGKSVGRWLAGEFHTMDNLRAASVADLAQIDKMGTVKATAIVKGLADMADVIDRLAAAGVNMGAEPTDDGSPKPLAGMTFVISGAVPAGYKNRGAAQEAIEAAGGKASGSVSKTTTALITDETTTSKAVKAASLGVPVIDPDQFDALLRGEVL